MSSKRFATSSGIRKIIDQAIASGAWDLEQRSKHNKIRHRVTGRLVVFAVSASDHLAEKNLARDIKHVECGMPGRGEKKEVFNVILNPKAKAKQHVQYA